MTTIYQALAAVMKDVQGVGKHEQNTAPNGGFMFRGIDAVTNAVGPALRKHGVIVVPSVVSSDYGTVVVGKNRTEMSHSQVIIDYTWYGPEGDAIVSRVAAESMDSGDKATAKAHSVAFRIAMLQTLCLPTDEPDPDSATYERSGPDPLLQAKLRVWELAQAKAMDRDDLANDFVTWSQGEKELATATLEDLRDYSKTLEPTTRVGRKTA